nr:hypothetical protein [Nesterenkonia populi]
MQNYEKPTKSSIAIPERMEGFELVMRHGGRNDWINSAGMVDAYPIHEIPYTCSQVIAGRRWDKT